MKTLSLLLALLSSVNANAIYAPNWDRPIEGALMTVTSAHFRGMPNSNHNPKIENFNLTRTQRDGSPVAGFFVKYKMYFGQGTQADLQVVEKQLYINSVEKDSCGSTVYHASLPASIATSPREMGERYNIELVDHSTRLCEDYRPYQWEITVTAGYGWCGTSDLVIEAVGNPEGALTIQSQN